MLYVNGITFRPTKHGRLRFRERFGIVRDPDIVKIAYSGKLFNFFSGFSYKWAPDSRLWDSMRLITVYFEIDEECFDAVMFDGDRESGFNFTFNNFQRRF